MIKDMESSETLDAGIDDAFEPVVFNGLRLLAAVVVIIIAAAFLSACSTLPDTPIGNYGGWGPVIHQSEKGQPYSCWNGDTEITMRGEENPDPQACAPIERT